MENISLQKCILSFLKELSKNLLIFNDIENERMVDDEMKVKSTFRAGVGN